MGTGTGWQSMWDGVAFATYNRQGGARGGEDTRIQNWFMGMTSRPVGRASVTLSAMLSLEPLTVGRRGYAEIFQHGEAYKGLPVTDRQHPHDLFMQLSAMWRRPLGGRVAVTFAGALVGAPAFGPPAFAHRASASENPIAPLSHHTLDSTHISMGVVTAAVEVTALTVEGSLFHGAEPDDRRYDLDLGRLDSAAGRVWWRPHPEWSVQASYAFLHEPEQLEPGNQQRSSASIGWTRQRPSRSTAVTIAGGQVVRTFSTTRATLLEVTHREGRTFVFGRYDGLGLETEHLLFPTIVHRPHPGELIDPLLAYTGGVVRDVARLGGASVGVGAAVTTYTVPERLAFTHGGRPVSFQVFVRVRPPAPAMGRMWDMTMTSAMPAHDMAAMPR